MKVEIEIPDIEELYFSEYEGEEISGKDFKKRIVSIAIEKFIDKMYDDYMNDRVYSTIKDDAKEIVKSHSKEIIDSVIDRVTNEVIKKRAIANEMPKKSEITNINKEWEEYFVRLIDKAIAKRFKQIRFTVSFGEYINRKGEMLLKEVIKLFKQIQETSSTNDKKAII